MSQTATQINLSINNYIGELPIIIVGTGPVGIRALQSIMRIDPAARVVIFGNEPWVPYNRVKLSSFLAGDIKLNDLVDTQNIQSVDNIIQQHNCAIVEIDRETRSVLDEYGQRHYYSKLVLAMGSQPHIPSIEGTNLHRVYTFRSLSDAEHLFARRVFSRSTVIIGGGLLGLEAARAMTRQNTQVSIVDHANRLMSQQLDEGAAEYLNEHVLSLGIRAYLSVGVKAILGEDKVEGVQLLNGKVIECDTVVFATGIVPNIDLARAAKLSVGKGIRVNNNMQTSDKQIYAIGECAQHQDKVYGIVSPGYEQAEVAIHHIFGKKSHYTGSLSATQLKVVGIPIFSMGKVGEEENLVNFDVYVYQSPSKNIYRKIILKRNRLIGVIGVGEFPAKNRIQESILHQRRVWPWQITRFLETGDLWKEEVAVNIHQWPASAIVCNCMGITRGQCSKAISGGCDTVEKLMGSTNASTVCGSCRPLLANLFGEKASLDKIKALKSFFSLSLIALLLTVAAFSLPALPYAPSVNVDFSWDLLWRDNISKQITGYSILGLSVVGLIISLRKRWTIFKFLDFSVWRYAHIVLGVLALVSIFLHTGFRLGANLNYWLMAPFLGLVLIGSITALFMSFQHRFDAAKAKGIRDTLVWGHILTFWPIPALLAMHIAKTYYF